MKPKFFKIFLLFFLPVFGVNAGSIDYLPDLQKADSLFQQKKFVESLSIYETILEDSEYFSPEMLLKMAYIKEGLGDFTNCLYYLNLFYHYYPDKSVLKKMEDVATRYRLEGYNYTDLEYFMSFYNKNFSYIIFFFLAASFTILIYLLIKKKNRLPLSLRPIIFFMILGIAFYINNYQIVPPKGIINNECIAMTAPSAGSSIAGTLAKGHRVNILGKEDIWYKIEWEEKTVYLREKNLLVIQHN